MKTNITLTTADMVIIGILLVIILLAVIRIVGFFKEKKEDE